MLFNTKGKSLIINISLFVEKIFFYWIFISTLALLKNQIKFH